VGERQPLAGGHRRRGRAGDKRRDKPMTGAPQATPSPSTYRRIRTTIGRLLRREAPGEGTLRRRLAGLGASFQPRRPGDVWRTWANASLRTSVEVDRAVAEVEACGLPAHKDRPKNWDLIVALGAIIERTSETGSVLEMGATQYSRLLPWLYLYGYRHLRGIDLVYDGPTQLGPIRYERMDLTATSYPDASFDAIACLSVIEHGVDLDAYLREAARLLRPGGILVTSTDFWCEPVDTRGQEAYGGLIRIFAPADIDRCLERAAGHGLTAAGPVDLGCDERVVHWERFGLDYTFLNFILIKSGGPASRGQPQRSPG
jgi:SAM-dependent methyltransferase